MLLIAVNIRPKEDDTYKKDAFHQPTALTQKSNKKVKEELPFNNVQDFTDTQRGFIAPLPHNGIIKNAADASMEYECI